MIKRTVILIFLVLFMIAPHSDTSTVYKVFLPVVLAPEPKYGLAMAHPEYTSDIQLLGVRWWYDWSDRYLDNPNYVPMLWSGKISPRIPQDYDGYILVFNEPNLPGQSNLTVEEAVRRYKIVREYYSQAKLVVGGTSIFAIDYLDKFIKDLNRDNYILPDYYHVHVYIEEWINLAYIKIQLDKYHKITGKDLWITEFNVVYPHPDTEFLDLLTYLDSLDYISRIAVYTNRQLDSDYISGFALNGCDLVSNDGKLTNKGIIYRDFITSER